jgi:hypothetical protein
VAPGSRPLIPIDTQVDILFRDPDVGLQTGAPGYRRRSGPTKYLLYAELLGVWRRAGDDTLFVIYQHLQKDARKRAGDVRRRMAELSQHLAATVMAVRWNDLAFLVASRSGPVALRAWEALLEHARVHGLPEPERSGSVVGVP